MIAEGDRGLAQPLPGILQILREILGESRFGRRPAVVRLAFLDPLLAVVALFAGAKLGLGDRLASETESAAERGRLRAPTPPKSYER